MLSIECSGTPYEIGLRHGREAKSAIAGTIDFYAWQFKDNCKMDWPKVQEVAMEFEPVMRRKWPDYLEEIRGVADGAERELADIVAINVRTEITFGCFSDGCTALSYLTPSRNSSFLAQNWDWDTRQKQNIVQLTVTPPGGKPTIKMLTEAGLIGKIGFNSAGVGVCLNAIKAKGMDPTRLPCHLGLRMVLESETREEAVRKLEKFGIASACHMLVADATGSVGLEWSAYDLAKINMNPKGQVFHSNHYLLPHKAVEATGWLKDSGDRVERIEELAKKLGEEPTVGDVVEAFKDEEGFPACICRSERSGIATLFNIVMDLKARRANVILGRPVEPEEVFVLGF